MHLPDKSHKIISGLDHKGRINPDYPQNILTIAETACAK